MKHMDLSSLVVIIIEWGRQLYCIIFGKPFLTVQVKPIPQGDRSGKETKKLTAFTIANESSHDMDVKRIWFLTSFNRPIFFESLDSKMPIKLSENERITYPVPIEELKAALNQSAGETITEVVALDQTDHGNVGRFGKALQEAFSR